MERDTSEFETYYVSTMRIKDPLKPYCEFGDFLLMAFDISKSVSYEYAKEYIENFLSDRGYEFLQFVDCS